MILIQRFTKLPVFRQLSSKELKKVHETNVNELIVEKRKFIKQNTFKKEYHDDGSYFCSYATGGNTLVCYKNNEKLEINLAGIEHPDKNHFLAKRANYFLNDLVKKKKLILKDIGNNLFEAF